MNNIFDNRSSSVSQQKTDHKDASATVAKTFMANVYAFMFAALAISGITAFIIGSNEALFQQLFIDATTQSPTMLFWIVTFSPLAFILVMSFGFNKLSSTGLTLLFMLYAFVMGLSLSSLFMIYSLSSISITFFITAGTFGVMSFLGYTTETDLTKFGSLLMMGVFGILIAMVVNWFLASPMLDYLISILGVIIFTGLIAYDTQRLKRIGMGVEYGSGTATKLAVMGALSLYLDFVLLFQFLLSLLGGRN